VKAVVMAGGEGTRLRPLTSNQPKPMVPIVGKPCMEHILELLKQHGLEDVIVTVAFMPQAIRSYFGSGDNARRDDRVLRRGVALGTAGSVRPRERPARRDVPRHLGDALCDVDLTDLIRFHREQQAAVTIGLKSVENPLEFGIVVTDEEGRIERFLEKPSWSQVFSDTINTGIYVLEPEVLRHVPTDGPYDFSKELFPLLLEMGRPAVRLRLRRLLAGHRQPRPVPAGELRRARRAGAPEHPGDPAARQRLAGGGGGGRRRRRDRGARVPRQLLPRRPDATGRPVLGARLQRDAARAAPHRAAR
jgi:NDP-sugar pyrophosphorylase family protein